MDIKLKKVEKDEKFEIGGATIQREWRGNELSSVKIIIGEQTFYILKNGWDNMAIFVPEKPKEIKKWRLVGETDSLIDSGKEKFDILFDSEKAANEFKESRPWLMLSEEIELVY